MAGAKLNLPLVVRALSLALLTPEFAAGAPIDGADSTFFETRIRPLLTARCATCHGGETPQAELRVDSRASLLTGGRSGPSVVPGRSDESRLTRMPPCSGARGLTQREHDDLRLWITAGAFWPDESSAPATMEAVQVTDADRQHWSFRPVARPSLDAKPEDAIDRLIAERLRRENISPNGAADRRALIRRLFFDLIGLPPTPEEVDQFLTANNPRAYEDLVDELLARPQFGERWGRHWLDVVRFGESNGYERDAPKPESWRYRDYVIDAYNSDKPYDRFVREQLAGDELDDISKETIVATGFYRIGVWDDEPAEKTRALFDELDEIVRVTSAAFLGLTIGCARCHGHMFDPIPHSEYYEFLAFFRGIRPYGRDKPGNAETHWDPDPSSIYTPLMTLAQLSEWEASKKETRSKIAALREQLGTLTSENTAEGSGAQQRMKLEEQIQKLEMSMAREPFGRALSVREVGSEVPPTHVLVRGDPRLRGAEADLAVPNVLAYDQRRILPTVPVDRAHPLRRALEERGVQVTSGRRRALAEWMTDPEHPLVARVYVNRIWQHLMGRGIVATPDNFGRAGEAPTHPKLLDWLASEFVAGNWRTKPLIRKIVTSRAYKRSSSADNPRGQTLDPEAKLYWRQPLRRLDAESIRDATLAVAGTLNLKMRGPSFFPALSKDVLATQSRPGQNWGKSTLEEQNRRSVYIFVKRTLMVPMLEAFDYTSTAETLGRRPVTTVAPQALLMLNSEFIEKQAAAFSARVARESGDHRAQQIERAFGLALGRKPSARESTTAADLVDREGLDSLCLVLLNTNEFIYLD